MMYEITYTPMEHLDATGSPQYDQAKLDQYGIQAHEVEKIAALGIEPNRDPLETTVGGITFKAGEPVQVDETVHQVPYTLMGNPWFKVVEMGKKAEPEDEHPRRKRKGDD